MATLILTAAGGLIGGRIGSAVGALVGQAIDQTIFAPAPRQGPRLSDLSVQSSTYGAPIPKVFGRMRVAGTVAWSTDLIETRSTQSNGKGRGSTETYSYAASFAVLLSGRKIVRVERIWADGKLLRGVAGDLKAELAAVRVHDGSLDQPVDPLIASAEGADTPAWRGQAYVVFEGLQLADYGNRIPSLSFEIVADEASVGVGAMIGELAGVVAETGPPVTGFAASGLSVRVISESVAAAFPMIVRAGEAPELRFVPVGAASPNEKDLGAYHGEKHVPSLDINVAPLDVTPASLSIAYFDPERDYQAGMQRVRREGGGLREGRVDLPAVLAVGAAHQIIHAALVRAGIERTKASVSLPWRMMTLRPGDRVEIDNVGWRVAAVQLEQMVVRLDLVRVAETSVSSALVSSGRPVVEVDALHGPTTIAIIDLPPLTDGAVARPSVAVFANGTSPGWRRAALLASTDGGTSYVSVGMTGMPAVLGATMSMLQPAPATLVDRINSVDIDLLNSAMSLSDADMPSLLAGANFAMIGDELLQFGRATPLAPGRWRLSELWRGRRGTEDAILFHGTGSQFVLIEAGAAAVLPAELGVAGVIVMATGIGDTAPYPTCVAAAATRAVMPLSPVAVEAVTLSGGDIEVRWTRRSREGWLWRDGVDAPLAEEREAYHVSWQGGEADTVYPRFAYTAAMRAADVTAGRTSTTFTIRQIGAAALSPPATLSIDIV